MNRFRCNSCYISTSDDSLLTSCGHFLCSQCSKKSGPDLDFCVHCSARCSMVPLSGNGKNLPQTVKDYFLNLPTMLERTADVYKFNRMHERMYIDHLEEQVRSLKNELLIQKEQSVSPRIEMELRNLKAENEMLKQKLQSRPSEYSQTSRFLQAPSHPQTPTLNTSRLSLKMEPQLNSEQTSLRSLLTTPSQHRITKPLLSSGTRIAASRLTTPRTSRPTDLALGYQTPRPLASPMASKVKVGSASRFGKLRGETPPI
ncbi:hypothetical protein RCL1_008816 [Eukaryota sp. TZLM3-RCL]